MKTQDEIIAALKDGTFERWIFGSTFAFEVLTEFLDHDHLLLVAEPGSVPTDWKPTYDLTREAVIEVMREYVDRIGWSKIQDHRGISANRTIVKCEAWMWLLGDGDLTSSWIETVDYEQYGAPILKLVCEKYCFPIPNDEPTQRMMQGKCCRPVCTEGCS